MPETPSSERPIDRVIRLLEKHGCGPKENGPGQYRSRCPVHKGSSSNLSISEGSDGAVLLHCHHVERGNLTCSAAAIARELGLAIRDLFPRREKRSLKPRKTSFAQAFESAEAAVASISKKLGPPTASWTYEEEHEGKRFPLMIVYRFDPAGGGKQFRPVHPAAEGWFIGDPPGKLPLYHLPEAQAAEAVVIVEGEKCADLMSQMGLVATTSAHGAQSPNKTDWAPLAGKHLAIVPDNDEPGEAFAENVAAICAGLHPKPRIKVLRLPLQERGDDVDEWIRNVVPDNWDLDDCRRELLRLWKEAPEWHPPDGAAQVAQAESTDTAPPNLTEWGNARRMAKAFGSKVRYCYPKSEWMVWDSKKWVADTNGVIWRYAKELPRLLLEEAKDEFFEDRQRVLQWALRTEQRRTLLSSIELLWSEPGIGVMPDDFDREPWLLNAPTGVIDLLSSEIREQRPEDLLSKITAVDYDPQCDIPLWRDVLDTVFQGNAELIAYVQRILGYALTGDVSEHAMFLHYGTGRNGKNTILDTVREVMGDYATVADPKIFLTAGMGDHLSLIHI